MSYIATGAAETDAEKLDLILSRQAEEARKRKLALALGAFGALIAAGKLGILAVPLIKAAKARK